MRRARAAGKMLVHQARFDLRALLRDQQSRHATVVLPLLLLVLLAGAFGDHRVGPEHEPAASYYVPGLAALAVIASSFVNLVLAVVNQRESGVLERRRATPVAAWVLIGGRTLTAMVLSTGVTTALLVAGRLAFGVRFALTAIPVIALSATAGVVCFCSLAYALSTAIGSAEAAQPTLQALMLPLYLGSGIFIPAANLPGGVQQVAALLPVERLADALHRASETSLAWGDLALLGVWGAGGLVVALHRFRWTPAARSP